MAVPDFQSLMLPIMQILSDAYEHTATELIDTLAIQFSLSDEDRKELLPSGRQARFDNRIFWAVTHLKKAGLIGGNTRGRYSITERGVDVLNSKPSQINMKFLRQFPEYQDFQTRARDTAEHQINHETEETATPEEELEAGYQHLRRTLAQELLERVKSCSPRFFEQLVVDLLVAMGYGGSRRDAGQAVGQSGDDGIDGIIKEDRLGLDVVYIQAKRWGSNVGRPIVQAFAGSLEGQRARKGIFITTSSFTQDAKEYVTRIEKKIVLIDGEQLAQLMIDFGVGVTEKATYVVKRLDEDYFSGE